MGRNWQSFHTWRSQITLSNKKEHETYKQAQSEINSNLVNTLNANQAHFEAELGNKNLRIKELENILIEKLK